MAKRSRERLLALVAELENELAAVAEVPIPTTLEMQWGRRGQN